MGRKRKKFQVKQGEGKPSNQDEDDLRLKIMRLRKGSVEDKVAPRSTYKMKENRSVSLSSEVHKPQMSEQQRPSCELKRSRSGSSARKEVVDDNSNKKRHSPKRTKKDKKKKKKKRRQSSSSPRKFEDVDLRDNVSLSSLSLSSCESPERVADPLDGRRMRTRPIHPRRDNKSPPPRRDKSPPRRRTKSRFTHTKTRYDKKRHPILNSRDTSWESKVEAFIKNMNGVEVAEKAEEKEPEAGPKEHLSCDNITLTPLMQFIGKKLTAKKMELTLRGVYEYSLLSLLSRAEWVAARTVQLLEEASFDNEWLYEAATFKGEDALKSELREAVLTGKVKIGQDPPVVQQALKVIEYIVRYFTFEGGEDSDDDKEEEIDTSVQQGNPLTVGMGETLKRLEVQEKPEEVMPMEEEPPQPPVNPWTCLWNNIQAENFRTFDKVESFLAQDLLRLGAKNTDDSKELLQLAGRCNVSAFEVAQNMVACWVVAGYNHRGLRQLVSQTDADEILPPRDPALADGQYIQLSRLPRNRGDKRYLAQKLYKQLKNMGQQLPKLTDAQVEYTVWKTVLYVMRGCSKIPTAAPPTSLPGTGGNIVFNYLPPGLREMENGIKYHQEPQQQPSTSTSYYQPKRKNEVEEDWVSSTTDLSTDPMNIIINPSGAAKAGELPNRRYLMGSVHLDWVVIKGKPQIFELSVYIAQEMGSLTLYVVTDGLQSQPAMLENLGFVANPDRKEFYYVQVGVGCVRALTLPRAIEKLAEFLDEKRNAANENRNNGLLLLFRGEEELVTLVQALENTGHKELMLDTVKGFATLSSYMDKDSSLRYEEPKLNMSDNDCAFYNTDVKDVNGQVASFISKSKAESLSQALEAFLQSPANYDNFIQPYCFPTFSHKLKVLKEKAKQLEDMYHLEVFLAAQLKQANNSLALEGIFARPRNKDLRQKCSVVASRVCAALVAAGLDKTTLTKGFSKDMSFTINPDVIVGKMDMPQKLKVMEQTMMCIRIIHDYFRHS